MLVPSTPFFHVQYACIYIWIFTHAVPKYNVHVHVWSTMYRHVQVGSQCALCESCASISLRGKSSGGQWRRVKVPTRPDQTCLRDHEPAPEKKQKWKYILLHCTCVQIYIECTIASYTQYHVHSTLQNREIQVKRKERRKTNLYVTCTVYMKYINMCIHAHVHVYRCSVLYMFLHSMCHSEYHPNHTCIYWPHFQLHTKRRVQSESETNTRLCVPSFHLHTSVTTAVHYPSPHLSPVSYTTSNMCGTWETMTNLWFAWTRVFVSLPLVQQIPTSEPHSLWALVAWY